MLRISATPPTRAAVPEVERRLAVLHAQVVATGVTTSGAYAGFAARPGALLDRAVAVNG
jgi:hypothetical protein